MLACRALLLLLLPTWATRPRPHRAPDSTHVRSALDTIPPAVTLSRTELHVQLDESCIRGCGFACALIASRRVASLNITHGGGFDAPQGTTRNCTQSATSAAWAQSALMSESAACSKGQTAHLSHLPARVVVIGAQKGGTTSLFAEMSRYRHFRSPKHKELHFWDECLCHVDRMITGTQPRMWCDASAYDALFPKPPHTTPLSPPFRSGGQAGGKSYPFVSGEASPSYLFLPQIASLIAAALPELRLLVVLLRNPVSQNRAAVV